MNRLMSNKKPYHILVIKFNFLITNMIWFLPIIFIKVDTQSSVAT